MRSDLPHSTALTICLAARLAPMEIPGRLALALNQAASALFAPLNTALTNDPVRIKPGAIVTTFTPVPVNSARMPSENAAAANFAQQYGTRCGTVTLPP